MLTRRSRASIVALASIQKFQEHRRSPIAQHAPLQQAIVLLVLLEHILIRLMVLLLSLSARSAFRALLQLLTCAHHVCKVPFPQQVRSSAQTANPTHILQRAASSASAMRGSHGWRARVQHAQKEHSRKHLVMCDVFFARWAPIQQPLERSQSKRAETVERATHRQPEAA